MKIEKKKKKIRCHLPSADATKIKWRMGDGCEDLMRTNMMTFVWHMEYYYCDRVSPFNHLIIICAPYVNGLSKYSLIHLLG